jgi:hypothetical protein
MPQQYADFHLLLQQIQQSRERLNSQGAESSHLSEYNASADKRLNSSHAGGQYGGFASIPPPDILSITHSCHRGATQRVGRPTTKSLYDKQRMNPCKCILKGERTIHSPGPLQSTARETSQKSQGTEVDLITRVINSKRAQLTGGSQRQRRDTHTIGGGNATRRSPNQSSQQPRGPGENFGGAAGPLSHSMTKHPIAQTAHNSREADREIREQSI